MSHHFVFLITSLGYIKSFQKEKKKKQEIRSFVHISIFGIATKALYLTTFTTKVKGTTMTNLLHLLYAPPPGQAYQMYRN